jgi:hypothetical protein
MPRYPTPEDANKAHAFAAIESIRSGQWDSMLGQFLLAIRWRMQEVTIKANAEAAEKARQNH